MRVVVVGTGLAGVLLAARLREAGVDLVLVGAGHADATAASGGLVRAFEPDPVAAALAARSLAELRVDAGLRNAAGFRPTGALYVLDRQPAPPPDAHLLDRAELERRFGLRHLPDGATGVYEPSAGYLRPDRLRSAVLSGQWPGGDPPRPTPPAERVDPGAVVLRGGGVVTGDAVVVAAGGWTPALLRASGHPTALRTKHIQYALLRTGPVPLPSFVDGTTGLWGRPTDDGRLLVGLPSQRWDVDPSRPPPDAALAAEVRRVAQDRLGSLAAVPLDEVVSAADCYHDPPGLALRHVAGGQRGPVLCTFTGGSGGAAKTALAASRVAAETLLETESLVHGGRE